jgi:hypothetical protein
MQGSGQTVDAQSIDLRARFQRQRQNLVAAIKSGAVNGVNHSVIVVNDVFAWHFHNINATVADLLQKCTERWGLQSSPIDSETENLDVAPPRTPLDGVVVAFTVTDNRK